MIKRPICIVGAGPTGLTAALLFHKRKIPFVLVDKKSALDPRPRARGLNLRSMEIMTELGLKEQLVLGLPPESQCRIDWVDRFGQKALYQQKLSRSMEPYSPNTSVMVTQSHVEKVLLEALLKRCPENVLLGTEVIQIDEQEDKIYAALKGKVDDVVEADYIIAADGETSPIREEFDFEMIGYSGLGTLLNIYYSVDTGLENIPQMTLFTDPFYLGRYVHSINGKDLFVLGRQLSPTSEEVFTDEKCIQLIEETMGIKGKAIEILDVSLWPIEAKIANPYCQGRIFLAGDAAHKLPPSGGLGMNCGIQDAHNLSWKLSAAIEGWASGEMLFSYFSERALAAESHIAWGSKSNERFQPLLDAISRLDKKKIVEEITSLDDPKTQLSQDLGVFYQRGFLLSDGTTYIPNDIWEPSATPGSRLPHFLVGNEIKRSIYEYLGQGFLLLTGDMGWREALDKTEFVLPLKVQQVDEEALGTLGISSDGAALVRPDGYVAWRMEKAPINRQETLKTMLYTLMKQA